MQGMDLVVDTGEEPAQTWQAAIQRGGAGAYRMLAHQPLDPTLPDRLALAAQHSVHAWAAVCFAAVTMNLANPCNQACILLRACTERSCAPGVLAAGTDPEQTTQPPHRVVPLLGFDEGEALALRSEENAIAFFKRSCSTFSCS